MAGQKIWRPKSKGNQQIHEAEQLQPQAIKPPQAAADKASAVKSPKKGRKRRPRAARQAEHGPCTTPAAQSSATKRITAAQAAPARALTVPEVNQVAAMWDDMVLLEDDCDMLQEALVQFRAQVASLHGKPASCCQDLASYAVELERPLALKDLRVEMDDMLPTLDLLHKVQQQHGLWKAMFRRLLSDTLALESERDTARRQHEEEAEEVKASLSESKSPNEADAPEACHPAVGAAATKLCASGGEWDDGWYDDATDQQELQQQLQHQQVDACVAVAASKAPATAGNEEEQDVQGLCADQKGVLLHGSAGVVVGGDLCGSHRAAAAATGVTASPRKDKDADNQLSRTCAVLGRVLAARVEAALSEGGSSIDSSSCSSGSSSVGRPQKGPQRTQKVLQEARDEPSRPAVLPAAVLDPPYLKHHTAMMPGGCVAQHMPAAGFAPAAAVMQQLGGSVLPCAFGDDPMVVAAGQPYMPWAAPGPVFSAAMMGCGSAAAYGSYAGMMMSGCGVPSPMFAQPPPLPLAYFTAGMVPQWGGLA